MSHIRVLEGDFSTPQGRFAIVAARFNGFIVEPLTLGALDAFKRHGISEASIDLVKVPGAWEIAQAARKLAVSNRYAGIVALGAVIRGSTAHFDFVAGECAKGLAQAGLHGDVPVIFGVLTTDTIEQAIERAGTKAGNKGAEAAITAIEMANLYRQLGEHS